MDELLSMRYATKEYVQARIAEAMHYAGSGGGSATLGPKSITSNGVYNASSDGLDGYDQVTVNVPGLEIVNGTFTLASDRDRLTITHNLGTYDVFVVAYVDADNYAALESGGYAAGTHSVVKIVAVIGNLNKDCQVKTFGISRLAASGNTVGFGTSSIDTTYTSINEVRLTSPNVTWWRAGITYKYTIVKYGENTTEMGA